MNETKTSFLPIYFTVFLDLLGLGIVIPIFAPLFLSGGPGLLPVEYTMAQRTLLLGLVIASYPLAQFIGAPILGGLSDRYGRKKMLLVSLVGTLFGYILFAIGIVLGRLDVMIIARLIDGFTGGNISIALSAISDLSDEKSKAKNFGMVGMVFGLGFILGPFIGGKLSDSTLAPWFNFSTPFFFAAALCLLNIIIMSLNFKETLKHKLDAKINVFMGIKNIQKALTMPNLRIMFLVVFLITFGFSFFTQFFQVYLVQKFNFNQSQIGDIFAYIGIWIAITQGLINRQFVKKYSPHHILQSSILVLAIALLVILIPNDPIMFLIVMPLISISNGLTYPNSTALISNLSDKKSQGEVLGINQSIQALGQAIPPLIAGVIVSIDKTLPIITASIVMFCAWAFFYFYFIKRDMHKFAEK
ncbi:MAG: MFS transporter [Candidatus Micrarchaeota archaeon]